MVLGGHSSTVASIETQTVNPQVTNLDQPAWSRLRNSFIPQVVTGSHDSTIRLWDLVAGKSSSVLTNHKKRFEWYSSVPRAQARNSCVWFCSVRALHLHPTEFTFASASADNMKVSFLWFLLISRQVSVFFRSGSFQKESSWGMCPGITQL